MRIYAHHHFMRFKAGSFSRDFPYYVAREGSDNLSLIESGRANQAESHAGGRMWPTSETTSGKCLSHKRKATRCARCSGTTKGTERNRLKLLSLRLYRLPVPCPPFHRESITRNGHSRIRKKTKFSVSYVPAHISDLLYRRSFLIDAVHRRCGSTLQDIKYLQKLQFNCKYNKCLSYLWEQL